MIHLNFFFFKRPGKWLSDKQIKVWTATDQEWVREICCCSKTCQLLDYQAAEGSDSRNVHCSKKSVLSMFPIDHVFLLPILQFIVSLPAYSPAVNNETCLAHNFLIVHYTHPSPQRPQCFHSNYQVGQCIKQCDSQLAHSRSMTPTLSVNCLAQVLFHNNKQLIYTPTIVFPRLRNIRPWHRTIHSQQSWETFSYFSLQLLCSLYNPTFSWLFTQTKSHNSSSSSALKGQLLSSTVYLLHCLPYSPSCS